MQPLEVKVKSEDVLGIVSLYRSPRLQHTIETLISQHDNAEKDVD